MCRPGTLLIVDCVKEDPLHMEDAKPLSPFPFLCSGFGGVEVLLACVPAECRPGHTVEPDDDWTKTSFFQLSNHIFSFFVCPFPRILK